MSKSKRTAKSNRKPKSAKKPTKPRQPRQPKPTEQRVSEAQPPQSDCPYRPGTLYGTLFTEGNRDFIARGELIKRVAELTGKSEKVVGFAYQVLKSKAHRSNKNRSTELVEGDKVKLIAIRK